MVEWLAGNRIKGTSTERTAGTPAVPAVVTQGGWKELGRATRGSEGALDVSSLADKRYYMVLTHTLDSAPSGNLRIYCNNDTGSNHSDRGSQNGGADFTEVSKTNGCFWGNGVSTECYNVAYWSNLATKEKLGIAHTCDGATIGAATAPERSESAMKWSDTTNPIDQFNTSSSIWDTNSEMVVLGWDPDDTHTTNFWEPLADVTLSSAGDNLSSGTITAKKYLWVQAAIMTSSAGTNVQHEITFNNDTGNNYAQRYSYQGGADATLTSRANWLFSAGSNNKGIAFLNFFIINNSANEKLCMGNTVLGDTAGAGTSPKREEAVAKWANTSSQITEIDIDNTLGSIDYKAGSFIKVWGSN